MCAEGLVGFECSNLTGYNLVDRSRIAAETSKAQPRQEESEEALSDKMAEFLRQQAEKESGKMSKMKISLPIIRILTTCEPPAAL